MPNRSLDTCYQPLTARSLACIYCVPVRLRKASFAYTTPFPAEGSVHNSRVLQTITYISLKCVSQTLRHRVSKIAVSIAIGCLLPVMTIASGRESRACCLSRNASIAPTLAAKALSVLLPQPFWSCGFLLAEVLLFCLSQAQQEHALLTELAGLQGTLSHLKQSFNGPFNRPFDVTIQCSSQQRHRLEAAILPNLRATLAAGKSLMKTLLNLIPSRGG
jgi:hypothetical protein